MKNEDIKRLDNEQLEEVTGGGGKKEPNFGEWVRCPDCGKKITIDKNTGRTVICGNCGAEVEI